LWTGTFLCRIARRDLDEVAQHPELAAFTYMRNQCQRCHHAVKGRQTRADYRGMGCSSCHMPYGAEGLYEGDDPSIPHDKPGHCLVHSIQSTRKAKVVVNGYPPQRWSECSGMCDVGVVWARSAKILPVRLVNRLQHNARQNARRHGVRATLRPLWAVG
jgi:hypothetical protein